MVVVLPLGVPDERWVVGVKSVDERVLIEEVPVEDISRIARKCRGKRKALKAVIVLYYTILHMYLLLVYTSNKYWYYTT